MHGKSISAVEILSVNKQAVWLLVKGQEYFLPYRLFPWFGNATINQIHHVSLLHGSHLYWPDLDIDLALESLTHPERYPLVARAINHRSHHRAA